MNTSMRRQLGTAISLMRRGNLHGLGRRLADRHRRSRVPFRPIEHAEWWARHALLSDRERLSLGRRLVKVGDLIRVTVVVSVGRRDVADLPGLVGSLMDQVHVDWELAAYTDPSIPEASLRELDRGGSRVRRIPMTATSLRPGMLPNRLLDDATGDWLMFLHPEDRLHEAALAAIALRVAADSRFTLVYTDDDLLDASGLHRNANFKPPWNPDLVLAQGLVDHTFAIARQTWEDLGPPFASIRELTMELALALAGSEVCHLPFPFCSRVRGPTRQSDQAEVQELSTRLRRWHPGTTIEQATDGSSLRIRWPVPDPAPRVSILIPTRDHGRLLERCIDSLLSITQYPDVELVLVDHDSRQRRARRIIDRISERPDSTVITHTGPFNYASMMNRAVEASTGDYLCLLNNDTEVIDPGWLTEMAGHLTRDEVGIVGALLLFGDWTIQHAGVHPGLGGLMGHGHKHRRHGDHGYHGRLTVAHEVAAVTGACLGIRRTTWDLLGGMDQDHLGVAYNDVDLCLRARSAGYRVLFTPHAVLLHHESASRGPDEDPAHNDRLRGEIEVMQARWGSILEDDPAYSPNLDLDGGGFLTADHPRWTPPWAI